MHQNPIRVDTVIVGAGQCGLSAGYYLSKTDRSFVILDENDRVGDQWRRRYDTLRLYTPARFDYLPGMSFTGAAGRFPTGREMGDFLERYAEAFSLPVVSGARVEAAAREGDDPELFVVTTASRTYEASNLVVAVGSQRKPHLPDFVGQVDSEIRQFHSDDYRNARELPDGDVLVVGASHSGSDIAMECASAGHETWLCGPDHGQLPAPLEGNVTRALQPLLWFAAKHVLTLRTPIGRKMQPEVRGSGGPLLRYRRGDLGRAGVKRLQNRVIGVHDGRPQLDDGTILEPATVIWCTGYTRDFDWLNVDFPMEDGWPRQDRGVVPEVPGLYFLGLLFQYAFASMLVGGAGRDAKHVIRRLTRERAPVAAELV
jgi:putative flavoprotein involved in K+ transport